MNVNLDADALFEYQADDATTAARSSTWARRPSGGWTVPVPRRRSATAACDPATYAGWPSRGQSVPFHLCFKSPTTYVNCQNPDNDPAKALSGEEHQRGIYFKKDASVVAQVTIHTDHPFWDSVLHDSPAHFDQFAAPWRAAGRGVFPTVTLEMTQGVDYTAVYTDALGNRRSTGATASRLRSTSTPSSPVAMAFDPQSVPRADRAPTAEPGCATTTTSRPTTRARRAT
jgi:hypothetical protein